MPSSAPLTLGSEHSNSLWTAINQIPDDVLTDYLADNVIDDAEIEDITLRLEAMCQSHVSGLTISEQDHAMIRHMVRHAVNHIRKQQDVGNKIENALSATTLGDIRAAMGHLITSGQLALNVEDARGETPTHGDAIPEDRPEDYDEEAPNVIDN